MGKDATRRCRCGRRPGVVRGQVSGAGMTKAAAAAASAGARPAASSAAMTPDSTSPDAGRRPRLPRRIEIGGPVRFGDDCDVALEQYRRAEVFREAADGADPVDAGGEPARRSNSPVCGVSTVGAERPRTRSGLLERIVSASASTITEKSVSSTLTRQRTLVAGAESGADHPCFGHVPRRRSPSPRSLRANAKPPRRQRFPLHTRTIPECVAISVLCTGWPRPDRWPIPPTPRRRPACTCRHGDRGGPAGGDVGGVEAEQIRSAGPGDVDEFDPSAIGKGVYGFEATEGDGQRRRNGRAASEPVSTSTPLGMSTATTGALQLAKADAASGRNGPAPEIPTTPSITKSVAAETACTTRPPDARNAARPMAWARSGLKKTASATAPRRRRNVAAHSASPPLLNRS